MVSVSIHVVCLQRVQCETTTVAGISVFIREQIATVGTLRRARTAVVGTPRRLPPAIRQRPSTRVKPSISGSNCFLHPPVSCPSLARLMNTPATASNSLFSSSPTRQSRSPYQQSSFIQWRFRGTNIVRMARTLSQWNEHCPRPRFYIPSTDK